MKVKVCLCTLAWAAHSISKGSVRCGKRINTYLLPCCPCGGPFPSLGMGNTSTSHPVIRARMRLLDTLPYEVGLIHIPMALARRSTRLCCALPCVVHAHTQR
jgi:hypothetical protein